MGWWSSGVAEDGGSCRDLAFCPQEKDSIELEIKIPAVFFSRGRGSGSGAGTLMYSDSLKPFPWIQIPSVHRQLVL